MQVYQSALAPEERPCALEGCPDCGGCQKLQRHGSYWRHSAAEGEERVEVKRFICPQCTRTWSVIPEGMLPYRSLRVEVLEQWLDREHGCAPPTGGGARPPPATQVEEGCIRRAVKRLSERKAFLCGVLGQQLPLLGNAGVGCFWRALRKLGSTEAILLVLARDFKTSLLGCYGSLRAHWEREKVTV